MPTVTALGAAHCTHCRYFPYFEKSLTSLWYVSRGFSRGISWRR